MKRNILAVSAISLAAFFGLTAESCDNAPTTQQIESAKQDRMQAESNAAVGMPSIVNWTEKRRYKEIFEKRDDPNLQTYTYLVGMHNEHTPLCRSVGYGIPESEQFTNPSTVQDYGGTNRYAFEVIPQSDPNGLYSSSSANGTWILCLTKGGKVEPQRSEPNVITLSVPWSELNQDGM
ncbi:hypothetical protein [Paraburkholderia sp. J11-2]|uniref:hypothetical protein n=1 Tax=Paraburkholderia sp. J11-2 TaxID=2805431 RepID=UPI002AB78288|nr:hypothetical protein [Paraburkholderia sp. J11-2]